MNFLPLGYITIWLSRNLLSLIILLLSRIVFIIYLFPYMYVAPMTKLPAVLHVGVLFDVQALAYFKLPFHLLRIYPTNKHFNRKENIQSFFIH